MRKTLFSTSMALIAFCLVVIQTSCKKDINGDDSIGVPTVNFSPASGAPGTMVSVTGIFYSTVSTIPNVVAFNGLKSRIYLSGSGNILTRVPSGATSGNVSVTVRNTTGSSAAPFNVTSGAPDPYVLDYSPKIVNGADGVHVSVSGVNFSSTASDNVVKFNGLSAIVSSATDTTLVAIVPVGATSGSVTVQVKGGTIVTASTGYTVPTPAITGFTPTFSIVGSTVVITGTGFSNHTSGNIVKFNGIAATVSSVDVTDAKANKLTVIIPLGATTGKISVTVDGQTGTSTDSFTVN